MNRLLASPFVRFLALSLIISTAALAQCGSCARANTPACHDAASTTGISSLRLVSAGADTVALADHIGRRPVALLITALDSMATPAFDTFQRVYAGRRSDGIDFIAVLSAPRKNADGAKAKLGLDYLVLADPERKVPAALKVGKLPFLVFYDASGKPVQSFGAVTTVNIEKGLEAAMGATRQVDPVCKMTVTPATAAATVRYEGRTYYFCSTSCRDAFQKNPRQYLAE